MSDRSYAAIHAGHEQGKVKLGLDIEKRKMFGEGKTDHNTSGVWYVVYPTIVAYKVK